MSNYNLSDNVQDSWAFKLRDKDYTMRYPTTSEIDEIQRITISIQEAQEAKDTEGAEKLSKDLEKYLYSFIESIGHETPIQEALKNENIKVLRNFNRMVQAELTIQ